MMLDLSDEMLKGSYWAKFRLSATKETTENLLASYPSQEDPARVPSRRLPAGHLASAGVPRRTLVLGFDRIVRLVRDTTDLRRRGEVDVSTLGPPTQQSGFLD